MMLIKGFLRKHKWFLPYLRIGSFVASTIYLQVCIFNLFDLAAVFRCNFSLKHSHWLILVFIRWICCWVLQLQGHQFNLYCCVFMFYVFFLLSLELCTHVLKQNLHCFSPFLHCFLCNLKMEVLILQWAEVLSADAFSAFEDAGLDDSKVWWWQGLSRTDP